MAAGYSKSIALTPALLLAIFVLPLSAAIIRVPQDQPTIQAGIDAASNGDTVLVAAGTYTVNLNFNGKNIVLKSASGPEATILTPATAGTPIIKAVSGEDTTATIDGFRLLRGSATNGGGILFSNSSGTVVNNIFDSCRATGSGGGVACMGVLSRVRVSNNVFKNGLGAGVGYADAIYCLLSTVEFSRNLVINNSSAAEIFFYTNSNVKTINNTIANNAHTAMTYQDGARGDVRNNIFYNNPVGGMININSSTVTVEYNDFFASPSYGSPFGAGNISQDPLFVGGSPYNYALQKNSSCIDAGDPATPVPPTGGARVDMGAFEFSKSLTPITPRGDIALKRPQFIWSQLQDSTGIVAASYRVVLAPNCDFDLADSSPVLRDTVWKVLYKLTANQNYCWKVLAVPDVGESVWTVPVSFRVVEPLPNPILPANNAILPIKRPTFIWKSVSDTSIPESFSYQIVLSTDIAFGVAETSAVLGDTVWKVDRNLTSGQTYYWKIIAIGDSGDVINSGISNFTFFVSLNLYLPNNNAALKIRQPTLIWQSVRDTSIFETLTYRVILSNASDFLVAESSAVLADTTWKVPHKLELYSAYYWKVESMSDSGSSILSSVKNFFVLPPPLMPILPQANANVRARQPTFIWSSVQDTSIPDVFSYAVQVAKNGDFNNAIASPILTDTIWQVSESLQAGSVYYWKVLGFYSSGGDTLQPSSVIFFRAQPSRIIIPDDRSKIQEGIDIALNGDTVWVKPGVYYENVFFKGKRVKVISEGGPQVTTIAKYVDGMELVNFSTAEDTSTVLSGFTITGATQVFDGAAIKIINSSPRIENNYIIGNSGEIGAISVQGGSPKIRRNLIAKDTGQAAILVTGSSGSEVTNCTIADNTGDAIQVYSYVSIRVTNCIITFNGGYGMRSLNGGNTSSTIAYDNVFGNRSGHFFAILPSTSILNADPQFIGGDPFSYRLSSSSPCIDAGDPAFPVPSGGGSIIDMGAFEFIVTRGDLNGDGMFSAADIVLELNCVFQQTGNCNFALTDLNCDGQLTATDVVLELGLVFQQISLPC